MGWLVLCQLLLPFGWKSSAYIYHTTGLVASHYLRSLNIPSSLYIDDRHNFQLSFPKGALPPVYQNLISEDSIHFALGNAAIFLTCYTLISLGYFLGLEKSTLTPSKQIPYHGFVSDSQEQAFTLLLHKKQKFIALINQALNSTTLDLFTLQRLSGKCMFLDLAIPGARLYSNDINLAISRATRSSRPIAVSNSLRKELQNSLFLDMWSCFLPWRSERHAHINSDSSSYPWGGVWSPGAIEANIYDYWDIPTLEDDIATKETLALNNVLLASGDVIRDSWVDAFVDSQTLIHSWNRQGSRFHSLIAALKTLKTRQKSFH